MGKIAIAGNIIVDAVKMIDAWPDKSMLVNITEKFLSVGGCVCNTAIDLKRLDPAWDISVYGKVGGDEYGAFAVGRMKEEGLDASGVQLTDRPTSFTDVMTVSSTGERTFFHMRGADALFTPEDLKNLPDCDVFHLGYLTILAGMDAPDREYGTASARLLHDLQSRGIATSIDVVSGQNTDFQGIVVPALKYCDYVVVNEVEAGAIAGISPLNGAGELSVSNLKEICRAVTAFGVKKCVVVHCPQLSCALTAAGEFTVLPSLDLPKGYIKGSVGAGDAFCAGMLYSFANGWDAEKGMRLASCMSVCNLSALDSTSGAKSLQETLNVETKFKRKRIDLC